MKVVFQTQKFNVYIKLLNLKFLLINLMDIPDIAVTEYNLTLNVFLTRTCLSDQENFLF